MIEKKVYIFSAPKHSGKTTKVFEWMNTKNKVAGILSPEINQHRYFFDIQTQQVFSMEATQQETEVYNIGKYTFSKQAFLKAEEVLRNAINSVCDWVIIDEIGPLELKGSGFHTVLLELLKIQKRDFCILMLVRDTLVQEVVDNYDIADAIVVHSIQNLDT